MVAVETIGEALFRIMAGKGALRRRPRDEDLAVVSNRR